MEVHELDIDAVVIVRQRLGAARPLRGKIERVSPTYLWVAIDGVRDHLRVARSTGRGTLFHVAYMIAAAGAEELAGIERSAALDDLRTALTLLGDALRKPTETLPSSSVALMRDVTRSIRGLVERP